MLRRRHRAGLLRGLTGKPDILWTIAWAFGLGAVLAWDAVFLNGPAFRRLLAALGNTLAGALLVVAVSLLLGWAAGAGLYLLERRRRRVWYLLLTFILNVIRSIPQIVGIMAGYIVLTVFIEAETVTAMSSLLLWTSFIVAVFVFLDVSDLVRARIGQFAAMDFYPAMLCAGVRESHIINVEILWKNSRAHLLNAMITTFGAAVFLECSIDFVLSVGLSTDVSMTNFPVTLGGLLATLDSKQDILAVGTLLSDPLYAPNLLFRHLQGISTAFALTFTLACVHQIAASFVRRRKL